MDNTAAGCSVAAHMASSRFNGQYNFPAGSDTQALRESIRATAVPTLTMQHKEVVAQTNLASAELALVSPLYRGRAASSPPAEAIRTVLKRVIFHAYEHLVEEKEVGTIEISDEDKKLLNANVKLVPLDLTVTLGLTDALDDRHPVPTARAATSAEKKKKKQQQQQQQQITGAAAKPTRSVLVVPDDFNGSREEYFAEYGKKTKKVYQRRSLGDEQAPR